MSNKLNIRDITDRPILEAGQPEVVSSAPATPELAPDQAGPDKRITLHFSLSLPDGEEIDSTFGKSPATYVYGDGSLLSGFEALVLGLRPGQSRNQVLSPEQAFGERNEDNVQTYPRYQFPADLSLETGLMLSFADSAGNEQAGVVLSADKQHVKMDFNHPLAGREIRFTVEIVAVEAQN